MFGTNISVDYRININMGCIETVWVKEDVVEDNRININMGCIETAASCGYIVLLKDKH